MTASQLALIPEAARRDLHRWQRLLEPLLEMDRGVTAAIADLAQRSGEAAGSIRRKYDLVRPAKNGGHVNWVAIVDRRLLGPAAWSRASRPGISEADRQLVKTYCERYQRSSDAAIDALRRDWRKGLVTTTAPLDPRTGYPLGWSPRNLARSVPTKFELKNARIGRSAAATERRLVYTTRAHLYVGSHYLFDDMWHDHMVNNLDQRKTGRPLEFHALDLYSAKKFAWGVRVRTEQDGVNRGLTGADFRFHLADALGRRGGYHAERGTILVVENGTAAIGEDLERLLHDETSGKITVTRSPMEGASAAAHQYAGRPKGNFRLKAALESLGNLIHNELAYLPGQTGKDRDHRPEQLHGLLRRNDALLCAIAQLPPERIEMLRWDLLTIQQFHLVLAEIYERINARTDHDLEGWDRHYVPDHRTGLMRRLSPTEVHRQGLPGLTLLAPAASAMLLARDCGRERTVRRTMIELHDGEVSGDLLRFDARALPEGEKFLTVLNPYDPTVLTCFDARGRHVGDLPRIFSVDRANVEAVMRAAGAARAVEAEALQPFRSRHAAQARQMARDALHNANVLAGVTPETLAAHRKQSSLDRRAADFGAADRSHLPTTTDEPAPHHAEAWPDLQLETQNPKPETSATPEIW